MAIDSKARYPKVDFPPIRIVRFSGAALTFEVQSHRLNGSEVSVYSPAKTVADRFKYRNKIGLDVAIVVVRKKRLRTKFGKRPKSVA